MKIFNWLKNRNKKKEEYVKEYIENIESDDKKTTELENGKVQLEHKEERERYIRDNCEIVLENSRQIEESKVEYQAVTSYLTDMQKIDIIPKENRSNIEEAARKIITLTRERTKFQNGKSKISVEQYKNFEQYEEKIPDEIIRMRKLEEYGSVIKNDMRQLEGEKGAILFEKEDSSNQLKYLKSITNVTIILVIFIFILLSTISYVFETDMQMAYMITVFLAAVSGTYIFLAARKNTYIIKLAEKKMNKAISLLNKVKIKCVNNTSNLEYSYAKYMVNNSSQFQYLWEEYMKEREAQKKYKKNTELLNSYNEILIHELRGFKIADPEIWVYQAAAILDSKEMVEIRHRLNVRRQKLRDKIDYNTKLRDKGMNEIKKLIETNQEWKEEVADILRKYRIDV